MKAIRCALKADVELASNQLHRVFNQGSFSLGDASVAARGRTYRPLSRRHHHQRRPHFENGLPPPAPNPPLLRIGPRNALTVIVAYLSGKPALRRPSARCSKSCFRRYQCSVFCRNLFVRSAWNIRWTSAIWASEPRPGVRLERTPQPTTSVRVYGLVLAKRIREGWQLLPHISRPYSERNRHDLAPAVGQTDPPAGAPFQPLLPFRGSLRRSRPIRTASL